MIIIGLDLSLTATGLVTIDSQFPLGLNPANNEILDQILITSTPKEEPTPRLIGINNKIMVIVEKRDPKLVVIEGAAFGVQKTSSIFTLGELAGIVKYNLYESGFPFQIVPPSTLKKWLTGKGNSKKDVMLLKAYKKFGVEFSDDNLCDAFILAKYGIQFLNPKLKLRKK